MLEVIILSIIQGLTEFLPISSSAHLILISNYLNFHNENLTLDISLHLGSLLAVILFFKKEILNFIQNKSLFIKIIISSLPIMIFGFLAVKFNLINQLRNSLMIGLTTVIFGVLLYFSDKAKTTKSINEDFSLKYAFYIGLFQVLSLIPGVSRSGITITVARFLNLNRVDLAKISFLLSIPTILAVSLYGAYKLIESKNIYLTTQSFLSVALSFIISFFALKFFIKFLKNFNLTIFVIYRIILGSLILSYVYFN